MPQLKIHDEVVGRSKEKVLTIDCLTEDLTVRELIRQRVYQEVDDYNRRIAEEDPKPLPKLLVTPTDKETQVNRRDLKKKRKKPVDWKKQYELACQGFESNAFFVLVGDRQAEELDETFRVTVDTDVTFAKLVPLVGG